MTTPTSRRRAAVTNAGLVAAGVLAGVAMAGTLVAQAATPGPTPPTGTSSQQQSGGSSTSSEDPHPGDNGADGIPESQEHHGSGPDGGHGRMLELTGTISAVAASTVTITSSSGTTTYSVTSTSDIDKNGEAALSDLTVGDQVRFSVDPNNATQINKLHAGDEAKDHPNTPDNSNPGSATPGNGTAPGASSTSQGTAYST